MEKVDIDEFEFVCLQIYILDIYINNIDYHIYYYYIMQYQKCGKM